MVWISRMLGRASDYGACAAALLISLSVAAEPSEAMSLSYAAPDRCPTEGQFVSEVQAYTDKVRFTQAAAARSLRIVVRRDGAAYSGLLELGGAAQTSRRAVNGDTCAEVVSALALATALAVDPEMLDGSGSASAAEETPAEPVVSGPSPQRREPPRTTRAHPEPPALIWSASAGAVLQGGVGDGPALGGAVAARVRLPRLAWQPSIAMTASGATSTPLADDDLARFRLATLGIEACPFQLTRGPWQARPCAAFDAGTLTGEGRGLDHGASESVLWLSIEARAVVNWAFSRSASLFAEVGWLIPLRHSRFVALPEGGSVVVHEVPVSTYRSSFGAELRFP
jgi:hypothetical protein